jgi:hypothetical protein
MGFEVMVLPDGSTIDKRKFEMISEMATEGTILEAKESLSEMLVAHAPEPPDWFRPVMPERPERPKRLTLGTAELDRIIDEWHWDDCGNSLSEYFSGSGLSDDQHTAVLEYELELESWQDELNQWELERERQRLAQWPWEYARLVMGARHAGA